MSTRQDESVQAVILAPTRELAIQITDEMRDLAAFKPGVRTVCLYGGAAHRPGRSTR